MRRCRRRRLCRGSKLTTQLVVLIRRDGLAAGTSMVTTFRDCFPHRLFLLMSASSPPKIRRDLWRTTGASVGSPVVAAWPTNVTARHEVLNRVGYSVVELSVVDRLLEKGKSNDGVDDQVGLLHSSDRGSSRGDHVSFQSDTVDAIAGSSNDFGAEPDCCFSCGHEWMLLLLALFRRKHHTQRRAKGPKQWRLSS